MQPKVGLFAKKLHYRIILSHSILNGTSGRLVHVLDLFFRRSVVLERKVSCTSLSRKDLLFFFFFVKFSCLVNQRHSVLYYTPYLCDLLFRKTKECHFEKD